MKRAFLVSAVGALVLVVPGVAAAKGDLVGIGVSGGGLPHEIRIAATNQDYASGWGAPPRGPTEHFYWIRFFVQGPGDSRSLFTKRERYYPARGRLPAVVMIGDGSRAVDWKNWQYVPASLAGRLDDAISAGLHGRFTSVDPDRFVTSWPLAAADLAIVVFVGAGIVAVRRRRLRRAFAPAPARPA